MQLLSPADVNRIALEKLFARADEIQNGATPDLSAQHIALALSYLPAPFPLDLAATLRDAGAAVTLIASNPNPDSVAQSIRAANATRAIVSHAQNDSLRVIAEKSGTPVLNAGESLEENPLYALLYAYAIYTLRGALQPLRIALLGNLKFAAEAHSLARVLGLFENKLSFISPAALSMPYDLTDQVRLVAYEIEETNDLATTLRKTDALVLVNLDAARVEKKIYDKLKTFYTLTPETFADAKAGLVILGHWDNADTILAPKRPQVERAARAMLLALCEARA